MVDSPFIFKLKRLIMNNLATTLLKKLNPANTPEKITVSELGDIYIRQVSIGEQQQISKLLKGIDPKSDEYNITSIALTFIFGVCDEHGEFLFKPDDVEVVKQIKFKSMLDIVKEINELNGIDVKKDDKDDKDNDDEGEETEAEKNS